MRASGVVLLGLLAVVSVAAPSAAGSDDVELVGDLQRDEVEAAVPSWVALEVGVEVDPQAAARLAEVGAGDEVVVYFGTWCSDSRRELTRLWRHLDEVGGLVPWSIRYVGLAHERDQRPVELVESVDLRYLPTFVVLRDGVETGRIVESSPAGIENDLAALLAGEAEGALSGRDDL